MFYRTMQCSRARYLTVNRSALSKHSWLDRSATAKKKKTENIFLTITLKQMWVAVISVSSVYRQSAAPVSPLWPIINIWHRLRRQFIFRWSQRAVAGQWCKRESILLRARSGSITKLPCWWSCQVDSVKSYRYKQTVILLFFWFHTRSMCMRRWERGTNSCSHGKHTVGARAARSTWGCFHLRVCRTFRN